MVISAEGFNLLSGGPACGGPGGPGGPALKGGSPIGVHALTGREFMPCSLGSENCISAFGVGIWTEAAFGVGLRRSPSPVPRCGCELTNMLCN